MPTKRRGGSRFAHVDRDELIRLGKIFDQRPDELGGRTVAAFLAESLLKVRSRGGEMLPLRPNRVQEEFERNRGRRNIVLKARQMGMSTWIAGRLFLRTITTPGCLTVQVAHTQESAESIFEIVHRFLEHLPAPLRSGALRTSRASAREVVFPVLDSAYRVESAADPNAGRGLTITHLHCSEVARWGRKSGEILHGLKAAQPAGGEIVLESTPNGAQGCFWDEWMRADQTGTTRHFFPWWWEPSYVKDAVDAATLTPAEQALMRRHGLTAEQIGFRRDLQANFTTLARQEYAEDPESCFAASGECIFDVASIDRRMAEVRPPLELRQSRALMIWLPPVPQRRYVVAVDPAGGGSNGDYSAAQVVDLQSGLQCAELQSHLPPLELAHAVAALAREYNDAWLVIERNNHGSGVLAYLKSVCKTERIYAQNGQDGWLTSALSKPQMVAALGATLVEQPWLFQSERLLRECRSFIRLKTGGTGAQAGSHDDCLMAMALALAVRTELVDGGVR